MTVDAHPISSPSKTVISDIHPQQQADDSGGYGAEDSAFIDNIMNSGPSNRLSETESINWDVNSKEQHIYSLLNDIEGADSGSEFMDEISDALDRTSSIPFHFGDRSPEVLEGLSHELDKTSSMPFLFEDRSPEGFEYISNYEKWLDRAENDKGTINERREIPDLAIKDVNLMSSMADRPQNHSYQKPERSLAWLKSNRNKRELRSYVTNYLTTKLSEKLRRGVKLPWSKMEAQDIINWPPSVKFEQIYQMNLKNVKKLQKLAKEDLLDFSPEFISRFKITENQNFRLDIRNYLEAKLARKLNVPGIKIYWSRMKAEDIINWPPDIEFRSIYRLSTWKVRKLQELAKQDLLDFSPEFLRLRKLQLSHNHNH